MEEKRHKNRYGNENIKDLAKKGALIQKGDNSKEVGETIGGIYKVNIGEEESKREFQTREIRICASGKKTVAELLAEKVEEMNSQ